MTVFVLITPSAAECGLGEKVFEMAKYFPTRASRAREKGSTSAATHLLCECAVWARLGDKPLLLNHHPDCKRYDPERELAPVLRDLVHGIEYWSAEEDGVHPDVWDAYCRAKHMIGEPVRVTSA